MVYLLGATIAGLRLGRGPAALTAVLSIACFNFFFVPPRLTFAVSNFQYLVTFAVMLAVALTIATLMANVRMQTRVAGARERRTSLLYAMSRELSRTRGAGNMVQVSVRHVSETFASQAAVMLPDAHGRVHAPAGTGDAPFAADASVAQWVLDHGRPAGLGTDALPGAPAIYLPLTGSEQTLGVLAVLPSNRRRVLLPEQRHLLETFAGQIALAIERAQLAEAAESARISVETESLRNTLLASISHDLRTPLAVIAGASSSLAERGEKLSPQERKALAGSIYDQSKEMSQLVANVLEMTRLEAGGIAPALEWHALGEIVGSALARLRERLAAHAVAVVIPRGLPLVRVDAGLMEQVFVNLLENAAKYTPPGTAVHVSAVAYGGEMIVSIEDEGPGLPPGDEEALFGKFQRGVPEGAVGGVGLGLAICRAILKLHGGRVWADRRPKGGAAFRFALPLEAAPEVPPE
jgi:two-component system sensor histidine kinase KdpD